MYNEVNRRLLNCSLTPVFQSPWRMTWSGAPPSPPPPSSPPSRYMGTMYTLDAFTTACPADQDILSHYKMQQVSEIMGCCHCTGLCAGDQDVQEGGAGATHLH